MKEAILKELELLEHAARNFNRNDDLFRSIVNEQKQNIDYDANNWKITQDEHIELTEELYRIDQVYADVHSVNS